MRAWPISLLLLATACMAPGEPEADAKIPGELVGVFAATGRIESDECGAELLGAENPWTFPVKLSRQGHVLYWLNGREAIVGDLDADEATFEFSTRVESVLTPARGRFPGCTISRRDALEGKLRGEGESVSGFEAELRYEYEAKNGSECIEFIGIPGGVSSLPCALGYRVSAVALEE